MLDLQSAALSDPKTKPRLVGGTASSSGPVHALEGHPKRPGKVRFLRTLRLRLVSYGPLARAQPVFFGVLASIATA